jgi:hypothetical protein
MGLEDHGSVQRKASRARREDGIWAEGIEKERGKQISEVWSLAQQKICPQHFPTMLWEMKKN